MKSVSLCISLVATAMFASAAPIIPCSTYAPAPLKPVVTLSSYSGYYATPSAVRESDSGYAATPSAVRESDSGYYATFSAVRESDSGYAATPSAVREIDSGYYATPSVVRESDSGHSATPSVVSDGQPLPLETVDASGGVGVVSVPVKGNSNRREKLLDALNLSDALGVLGVPMKADDVLNGAPLTENEDDNVISAEEDNIEVEPKSDNIVTAEKRQTGNLLDVLNLSDALGVLGVPVKADDVLNGAPLTENEDDDVISAEGDNVEVEPKGDDIVTAEKRQTGNLLDALNLSDALGVLGGPVKADDIVDGAPLTGDEDDVISAEGDNVEVNPEGNDIVAAEKRQVGNLLDAIDASDALGVVTTPIKDNDFLNGTPLSGNEVDAISGEDNDVEVEPKGNEILAAAAD